MGAKGSDMIDDDFRAGEALALEWIEGRTSLTDDLAVLVLGMTSELSGEAREFGGEARGFLVTLGNAARQAARRETNPRSKPIRPRAPDPAKAPPSPEAPPGPTIDINEMFRRRRESERARRLEEFGRRNAAAWGEQAEMVHRMGGGGDWGR
jgi:hypothetical protein